MKAVEGRTDLVRDPNSGAIINIDSQSHKSAVDSARAREQSKRQIELNSMDINNIKEELSDIKDMMKQLLGSNLNDGR
jgi:hypothetical protein